MKNHKRRKVVALIMACILLIAMMPQLAWAAGNMVCPDCGGTLEKHDYTDATCTSAGNVNYYQCTSEGCGKYYIYTDTNGYVETTAEAVVRPQESHTLKKVEALAASCDASGHKAHYYCTNCNAKFSDEAGESPIEGSVVISALGHDYQNIEGQEASEATCTKASEIVKECTRCHKRATITVSPALGHNFDTGSISKDSTCTSEGTIKLTCQSCGHTETRAISANGHTSGNTIYHDGSNHWYLCTVCGVKTHVESHVGYLEWKYADEETHNQVCKTCGHVTENAFHTWGEGQIIKNATATETGTERFSCSVCEATKDVVIPMLTDTGDGNGNQGEAGGNEGEGGSQGGNGGSQGGSEGGNGSGQGGSEGGNGSGSGAAPTYTLPVVTPVTDTETTDGTTDGDTDDDTDPEKIAAQEKIVTGVENTQLKGKSAATQGKITLTWQKEKGFKVDGYQIYRSTKKTKGYKKFFTTTKTSYTNTKQLKSGTRYYYKVRGYRKVAGETVYTKWSNLMSKIAV